jgi:peptide/nickel transport system substrate-binding protein
VIAVKQEPATIVARPLQSLAIKIKTTTRLFNASFDLIDDRGVAQPYLAEALPQLNTDSWKVFPDGKMETTYRLKPNLVWHDGTPLTADDWVFAHKVYTTPEFGLVNSPPFGLMEEVTAPDPRTLVIKWRRLYPQAGVLQATGTITDFPPLPRQVLDRPLQELSADAFAAHPFWTREFIGAGPYKLDRWEAGSSIEGLAFDQHAMGRPKIARIRILFPGDANTALATLLSGNIHAAMDDAVGFQQGVAAKREFANRGGGTFLVTTDLWRATYFQFRPEMQATRGLFDLRVRRALAHALDRQAVNDAVYEGEGVMAETILPNTLDYYPAIERTLTRYPYDVRRSDQLMAEAGFSKGGDGVYSSPTDGRLSFELKVNASPQYENERSIMASVWRQAGFDVQEATLPAAQSQDGQARASFPGLYGFSTGIGTSVVPNFTTPSIPGPDTRWTGNNRGGWSNPEYDRIATTFNNTLDRNERIQILSQITKQISDELPAISLYYDLGAVAIVPGVQGPRPISPDTSGLISWNIPEWELR